MSTQLVVSAQVNIAIVNSANDLRPITLLTLPWEPVMRVQKVVDTQKRTLTVEGTSLSGMHHKSWRG